MIKEIEKFSLTQEYSVDVEINFNKNFWHCGTLNISPKKIELAFVIELTNADEEKIELNYAQIKCKTIHNHFLLLNLKSIGYAYGGLDYSGRKRFIRGRYSVEYVLSSKIEIKYEDSFLGFIIHSENIHKWLGNTELQEKIITDYNSGINYPTNLCEVKYIITPDSSLTCEYQYCNYVNSPEQKAGITFPPVLKYVCNNSVPIQKLLEELKKTIEIFSFILGFELAIETIDLLISTELLSPTISLFFCTEYQYNENTTKNCFFAFARNQRSRNQRFKMYDVPEFPENIFGLYFGLAEYEQTLFKQYLKQQKMEYTEDRFLSIFRLVEKMAYEEKEYFPEIQFEEIKQVLKDFLKRKSDLTQEINTFLERIKSLKKSKYNTEKTIINIFDHIKALFFDDVVNKATIHNMTKLRNDITHANEYSLSEEHLIGYIAFLNIFAAFLFLTKYLKISDSDACKLVKELYEFQHISYINHEKWWPHFIHFSSDSMNINTDNV